MSIINEALAPCTKCGQQHKVTVYRSINISENPELKAKVTDGSLFLWECPHCGQVNLTKYETLYHDPSGKLMVWLIPEGEISETQMHAITMHTKAMGGYTLRRVNDMGSLMEKVLINTAGLDDAVLEMCKSGSVTLEGDSTGENPDVRLIDEQKVNLEVQEDGIK